jgi:tRNA threonylcarbamoyladenosine modification (KEOPS) complex  Pcc1 subunit
VKTSLLPEVKRAGFGRAQVELDDDGFFLVLKVKANDTVALRSTLNAYLRWINSTMNVLQVLDQQT